MKRMFILFSLFLALIIVSTTCVWAGGPSIKDLKGDYATIETRYCVQADDANGYFGPSPPQPPQYQLFSTVGGNTRLAQFRGVLRLFGDGHGSWDLKALQIFNKFSVNPGPAFPIEGSVADCDMKYKVIPDGTIELTSTNCVSTDTAGGSIGTTYYTDTDHVELATLSADGNTLVFSDVEPNVEIISWTIPNDGKTTRQRICSRTGTAIRLPDKGHK
jgi:hypothetical protein